jgi:site-specific recombinase
VVPAEQILAPFPEAQRRHRRVRELGALVGRLLAAGTLAERVDALVALLRWAMEPDRRLPGAEPPELRRLHALLQVIEQPAVAEPVQAQVAAVLAESDGVPLLAGSGLPNDRGLVSETTDRLFHALLPAARDDRDLGSLLSRLLPTPRSVALVEALPEPTFARLVRAFGPASTLAIGEAARDAFVLIGARVQGLGLSQPIRQRSRPLPVPRSPFYALPRAGDRVLAHLAQPDCLAPALSAFHEAVAGCRAELTAVLAHLEETGISLDVVYELEVIEHALRRLELLAQLLGSGMTDVRRAVVVLARARLSDRSLRDLAYNNLHLLARKLVERAGRTGEHYITSTRRQYWQMLGSAAGGGVITLFTAALKLGITSMHLPLFVEGLLAGSNYSVSFLLIQLLGFTLATKQPSMTAATLAGSIHQGVDRERTRELQSGLIDQAACIVRSQLCAAAGNVTTVVAAAVAFDELERWRTGHAFLGKEKAAAVLASLHPLHSGTIWYAAVTGVILWASSLAGGWVENFAVYRRLPQAIAEHRLGRLVGRGTMRWLSRFFARNISGYAGSVALGFMLGMTPPLGAFLGLPLDVRHVTLSTGSLALALASFDFVSAPTAAAIAGIACIFVVNLAVSFVLALTVALRARRVPRRDRWALLTAIAGRFLRHPGQFLFPPR